MFRVLREMPLHAVGNCGKQFTFEIEPGSLVRETQNKRTLAPYYGVEVMRGKFEGLRGFVHMNDIGLDTLVLTNDNLTDD